jgi:hypothetical protein
MTKKEFTEVIQSFCEDNNASLCKEVLKNLYIEFGKLDFDIFQHAVKQIKGNEITKEIVKKHLPSNRKFTKADDDFREKYIKCYLSKPSENSINSSLIKDFDIRDANKLMINLSEGTISLKEYFLQSQKLTGIQY